MKKINEIARTIALQNDFEILDHYAVRALFPADGDGEIDLSTNY